MLRLFNRTKKIDLSTITRVLSRRNYVFTVSEEGIRIQGKYVNNGKTFTELVLVFKKNKVSFKDTRGNFITKIPREVASDQIYPHIKDIFGLV